MLGFPYKVKLAVRNRAFFRCCICHQPFVEVHHIIPEADGGNNTLENAAPLCARCHDLFGGNPDKRKRIRQMRDNWYELMDKRKSDIISKSNLTGLFPIEEEPKNINLLKTRKILLYHIVFEYENFEESTKIIFDIVKYAQNSFPNYDRIFYLDIEDHKNKEGGFDNDMFELIRYFILEVMMQFLSEIYTPLVHISNKKLQRNDLPDELIISDERKPNKLINRVKKI